MFSDNLPDSITFHLPDSTKTIHEAIDKEQALNYDDDRVLHRQLICWLAFEKYWKWVIRKQKSHDEDIEGVEKFVRKLEQDNEFLENPYSPTKVFLHSNKTLYPHFVMCQFVKLELEEGMIR